MTAARPRAAVTLYVGTTVAAAAVCLAAAFLSREAAFPPELIAFILLAAVTDLREVRLPAVGHVTMSFVPVFAALIVFGLWPAMVVATVSGIATVSVTHDPRKVLFNVGNYVVSTFVAGLAYLVLLPAGGAFLDSVLPVFAATGVDFLVNTILLAGVLAVATGEPPVSIWRTNYQWGLASYMTGASLSLLVALLYLALGIPGLILGLPPLYLIYYSYDVYVGRVRDRARHGEEVASFRDELANTQKLHEDLREAQLKVAAEIERARRIQADLLPHDVPQVPGLSFAHRIEFLSEMGGDYYDFLSLPDGRVAIVCGDVMGKGLAAALIMTMARSLIHSAAGTQAEPSDVLGEVNDALTRDLEGQQMPYFMTLVFAVFDPATRDLTVANGGHNPLLVFGPGGDRWLSARGSLLGMRAGLEFPQETIRLSPGETVAFFTDGLTEARDAQRELLGLERLTALLDEARRLPVDQMLDASWRSVRDFRGEEPASDDATLLLMRVADGECSSGADSSR